MKKQIVTIGIILTFLIMGFSGCTGNSKSKTEIKITNVDIKESLINNNTGHVYNITATFKNTGNVRLDVDLIFQLNQGYVNQTEGSVNSIVDKIFLDPGDSMTITKTLRGDEWDGAYYFQQKFEQSVIVDKKIITEDRYRSQKYFFQPQKVQKPC